MTISSPPPVSLADVLDRVLDRGIVAAGEVKLSLAGVDLVYINLNLLVASAATILSRENHGTLKRPDQTGFEPGRTIA